MLSQALMRQFLKRTLGRRGGKRECSLGQEAEPMGDAGWWGLAQGMGVGVGHATWRCGCEDGE